MNTHRSPSRHYRSPNRSHRSPHRSYHPHRGYGYGGGYGAGALPFVLGAATGALLNQTFDNDRVVYVPQPYYNQPYVQPYYAPYASPYYY